MSGRVRVNNTYHKCLHIPDMRRREGGRRIVGPYIVLPVAGSKQLVIFCPSCHMALSRGETIGVKMVGRGKGDRFIKRYNGDCSPVFFEVIIT